MKDIKNIIFDLGGVVIDLDRNAAVSALEKLGITDASKFLGEYSQKGSFLALEKGEISESEIYDTLLSRCHEGTTATDIRDAFEEFLIEIPVQRLRTIRELREKGYRLFVLSNTNPIMYNHWIDNAFRAENRSINDYFDGIVVSFQERTCKPDPEIFARLVKRYGLDPEETIMLDDSEANCKAAESIGLKSAQITGSGENSFENICSRFLDNTELK